jgi:hypothetical protein
MLVLVKLEAKSWLKCVACGEQVVTCEKYLQVQKSNGKPVRGERYCVRCEKYARLNNPELGEVEDPQDEEGDDFRRMQDAERRSEDYAAYQAAGCTHEYWNDRDAGYAY